jgi:hypothetical protein
VRAQRALLFGVYCEKGATRCERSEKEEKEGGKKGGGKEGRGERREGGKKGGGKEGKGEERDCAPRGARIALASERQGASAARERERR